METVLSIHRTWAYVAIAANAIAGIVMLLAWRIPRFRGRWNWWVTWAAEGMMLVQIALGITLVSSAKYKGVPRFHMFYGFIAFLTIGVVLISQTAARQARDAARPVRRGWIVHHGSWHSCHSASQPMRPLR